MLLPPSAKFLKGLTNLSHHDKNSGLPKQQEKPLVSLFPFAAWSLHCPDTTLHSQLCLHLGLKVSPGLDEIQTHTGRDLRGSPSHPPPTGLLLSPGFQGGLLRRELRTKSPAEKLYPLSEPENATNEMEKCFKH